MSAASSAPESDSPHQLLAFGAGLFVLAWVERYPALSWFNVGYLVVAAGLLVSTWPSLQLSQGIGRHPVLFAPSRYLTIGALLLAGSAIAQEAKTVDFGFLQTTLELTPATCPLRTEIAHL
jgi:hypothetical protein